MMDASCLAPSARFTRKLTRGFFPASAAVLLFLASLLLLAPPVTAQDNDELQLPVLGDASSSAFSLQKEYQLGRAWLMIFRSQVEVVHDPLLEDYVRDLTYRLATFSELKDRRLQTIVVNNRTLNAFAVPGGVIGVHNGLFMEASTEAQFASVLTHELAHLSQRHFARSVEAQKRNSIPAMAGLLAGILLAATAGGDAGMAAITATQAATLQNQLRYSRLHEQEADRAGMQTLARADMDPSAAAAMFEQMQAAARYAGTRPPEFLLTHPVTESRISDARNRARQYPRKMYTDSTLYQLMRARVEVSFFQNSKEAVKHFQARTKQNSRYPDADQYGLVLALTADGNYGAAQQHLQPLLAASPNELAYLVAQAELYLASGQYQEAINLTQQRLALSPGNHPLTMLLAEALLKANQPHKAEALLKEHSRENPNDPAVWYMLAETHGLAGNIVGVHQARAEYFVLNGILDKAIQQLQYALPMLKGDHVTTAKVQERIRQIQDLKRRLEEL